MKDNKFTKEFIRYSNSDKASHVKNTLIKEVFVDTGIGYKVFQDAIINGVEFNEIIKFRTENDPRAQNIKLTYEII